MPVCRHQLWMPHVWLLCSVEQVAITASLDSSTSYRIHASIFEEHLCQCDQLQDNEQWKMYCSHVYTCKRCHCTTHQRHWNQRHHSSLEWLGWGVLMAPDKNKLKELIQKSATKDILYLHINPVEPKSLQSALKELQKFVGNGGAEVVVVRYI